MVPRSVVGLYLASYASPFAARTLKAKFSRGASSIEHAKRSEMMKRRHLFYRILDARGNSPCLMADEIARREDAPTKLNSGCVRTANRLPERVNHTQEYQVMAKAYLIAHIRSR